MTPGGKIARGISLSVGLKMINEPFRSGGKGCVYVLIRSDGCGGEDW